MKKVLIISYYFNQREKAASIRPVSLANYLPHYDWEPTIVTAQLPKEEMGRKEEIEFSNDYRVIETQDNDIQLKWKKRFGFKSDMTVKDQLGVKTLKNKKRYLNHLLHIWDEYIAYPDGKKGWYSFALKECKNALENDEYSAIISTGGPIIAHIIARDLSEKYDLPWILDLQDLWTQNHYYHSGRIRKFFETRLELKIENRANVLTTVSEPWAKKLNTINPGKKVHGIVLGFDPREKNNGARIDDKFSIVYTGTIYLEKQDPEPLFVALKELILEKQMDQADIAVNFFGTYGTWLHDEVNKYGLKNIVNISNEIPRPDAINRQRQAQLLLLLKWIDANEKGVYTSKLFEYLAAQRPIMAIGTSESVIDHLLKETNCGFSLNNVEEIKQVIKKSYDEFKTLGAVRYQGTAPGIDKYSQQETAKKFAEILDEITYKQ